MLSKSEVLQLLVVYARMRDQQLVENDQVLSADVCLPEDRRRLRRIMALLVPLRDSFRYEDSPDFQESVAGKSEALKRMKEKLASDPLKRREAESRFDRALRDLLSSDEAFRLTPTAAHPTLREIAELASGLAKTDDNQRETVQ